MITSLFLLTNSLLFTFVFCSILFPILCWVYLILWTWTILMASISCIAYYVGLLRRKWSWINGVCGNGLNERRIRILLILCFLWLYFRYSLPYTYSQSLKGIDSWWKRRLNYTLSLMIKFGNCCLVNWWNEMRNNKQNERNLTRKSINQLKFTMKNLIRWIGYECLVESCLQPT